MPRPLNNNNNNNKQQQLNKKKHNLEELHLHIIPLAFRCPISLDLMRDPVILCTGHTYDRSNIERWIASGNTTCPITMQTLHDFSLTPNHTLRRLIQDWCVANRCYGVDRIPTPTQPADPASIRDLMAELMGSSHDDVPARCVVALRSLRRLAKDSAKNRALMAEAGVAPLVLAAVFVDAVREDTGAASESSAEVGDVAADAAAEQEEEEEQKIATEHEDGEVLDVASFGALAEEALATVVLLPLADDDRLSAAAPKKLRLLSQLLRKGRTIELRTNAAALIETLSDSKEHPEMRLLLANTQGVMEGLVALMQLQQTQHQTASAAAGNSKRSVNIAIKALFSLCLTRQGKEKAVEAGVAGALMEKLGNSSALADRSCAERALGAIELLCTTEAGVRAVASHSMAASLLVRLILMVSDRATEFAAGSLLAICSFSEKMQREAVEAGVVKELLLLMQSGCTHRAKSKAMNLLKLLSGSFYDQQAMLPAGYIYGRADVVPF